MEILSASPSLVLVPEGNLTDEERTILSLTPAAISILAVGAEGVHQVARNERYERIFSGGPPPEELLEQAGLSIQVSSELSFELACETPAAVRQVRFRLQPISPNRVVCVAEDITVAHEAAREVSRQREFLRSASPIDPLTGAMGRRRFMEDARLELRRATRHTISLALVLIDVDRLQELNDTLSSEAGDAALHAVAEVLRSGLRDTDLIARVGGDEFALLLLHTDGQYGRIVTDRLRETVTIRAAMFEDGEIPLTISAGVVEHRAGESLEDLVGRAETALYTAKASGRDRVMLG